MAKLSNEEKRHLRNLRDNIDGSPSSFTYIDSIYSQPTAVIYCEYLRAIHETDFANADLSQLMRINTLQAMFMRDIFFSHISPDSVTNSPEVEAFCALQGFDHDEVTARYSTYQESLLTTSGRKLGSSNDPHTILASILHPGYDLTAVIAAFTSRYQAVTASLQVTPNTLTHYYMPILRAFDHRFFDDKLSTLSVKIINAALALTISNDMWTKYRDRTDWYSSKAAEYDSFTPRQKRDFQPFCDIYNDSRDYFKTILPESQ